MTEFRTAPNNILSHAEVDADQFVLPLDLEINREVHWMHGVQTTRWGLLGRKIVTKVVLRDGSYMPKVSYIDSSAIANLKDPALRYALRFSDAAHAVGWTETSAGCSSAHEVMITALDEGIDSQLLNATYTGVGKGADDSFLLNLHNAAP